MKVHSHFPKEYQEELDNLFHEWNRLDAIAESYAYENILANKESEAAAALYDAAIKEARTKSVVAIGDKTGVTTAYCNKCGSVDVVEEFGSVLCGECFVALPESSNETGGDKACLDCGKPSTHENGFGLFFCDACHEVKEEEELKRDYQRTVDDAAGRI
ncbi:MAG: hypothetical protein GY938_16815 [Ketobacter sp.]|nr:hypothetical protein [Ketobacter sp.]